jgi:hypothetical protein
MIGMWPVWASFLRRRTGSQRSMPGISKNGWEAVEKGKAIGAKTERERDWLAAIELYYKDYDKVDQTTRGFAYEKAMEQLMQKYPMAVIFTAIALATS